ncbi:hypothetical protein L53_13000 [Hyphomonas sp. L-53-1-40]|nr:hypothetical protein L53_13000 [Hyphomonas sp. L-53-1-40]
MIRPKQIAHAAALNSALQKYSAQIFPLPGVDDPVRRNVLVAQILESIRRIEYVKAIASRPIDPDRADPKSDLFDPLKAALLCMRAGDRDEAFWLIFLATHFSKHAVDGWGLMRAVYGRLGTNPYWSWAEICSDLSGFRLWLRANQTGLSHLRFGNHRKYESKRENSPKGLAAVVESYVAWVGPPGTHDQRFTGIIGHTNDPTVAFEQLYQSVSSITRWGRLGAFDHLTMIGKLGLLHIEPGRTFLKGATGPRAGTALLLNGDAAAKLDVKHAEAELIKLGTKLSVGQQVLEDSLCNWQKSPSVFVAFR